MNRILFAIAAVWCLSFAYADAEQQASEAIIIRLANPQYAGHDAKNYSFSADQIKDIRRTAMLGDEASQYNLGAIRYVKGAFKKAAYWFRRAATRGYADAQYNLGILYYNGTGVRRDYADAAAWLKRSAQQGQSQAQFRLATLYYTGRGVGKDVHKEAHWYKRAARRGSARAQYNLAVMYQNGEGVARSDVKAYAWLMVASRLGLDTSQAQVIVTAQMSRVEIERARRLRDTYLADQPPRP